MTTAITPPEDEQKVDTDTRADEIGLSNALGASAFLVCTSLVLMTGPLGPWVILLFPVIFAGLVLTPMVKYKIAQKWVRDKTTKRVMLEFDHSRTWRHALGYFVVGEAIILLVLLTETPVSAMLASFVSGPKILILAMAIAVILAASGLARMKRWMPFSIGILTAALIGFAGLVSADHGMLQLGIIAATVLLGTWGLVAAIINKNGKWTVIYSIAYGLAAMVLAGSALGVNTYGTPGDRPDGHPSSEVSDRNALENALEEDSQRSESLLPYEQGKYGNG